MNLNKAILLFITLLTGISFSISSCEKEEDGDHHSNSATINITSPASDAYYNVSDTVNIHAALTAAETLHGCDIYIRKKSDNSVVFTNDVHTHSTTIAIDTFWVNTLSGDTADLELEIIATLDHDGNTQGKKVTFTCLP